MGIAQLTKALLPDALLDVAIPCIQHRRIHGKLAPLLFPRTFTERLVHRKMFGRDPILSTVSDKYAARGFIEERVGAWMTPELYFATNRPEEIPWDRLPQRYVVKPNHASGMVRIVRDSATVNTEELTALCKRWLAIDFHRQTREWVYKHIPRRILIEELIDDGSGKAPADYKFFCFHGRPTMIQVDTDRFTGHKRAFYTPGWSPLDIKLTYPPVEHAVVAPAHLKQMVSVATALSEGFPFVRVDIYDTSVRLYVGELGVSPEAGWGRLGPLQVDVELGRAWRDRDYLPKLPLADSCAHVISAPRASHESSRATPQASSQAAHG